METADAVVRHYEPVFTANFEHLPRYGMSMFRDTFGQQTPGKGVAVSPIEAFGKLKAKERKTRFEPKSHGEVPRERRWMFPRAFDWSHVTDDFDIVKSVADPTSELMQSCYMSLDEEIDLEVLVPSFFADVIEGESHLSTGVKSYNAANSIAVTIGSAGGTTPTGLNLEKIKDGFSGFRKRKVIKGNKAQEKPHIAITSVQERELWDILEAVNGDYRAGWILEQNGLPDIRDYVWHVYEDLPVDANGYRRCPIWMPSGMAIGMWQEPVATMRVARELRGEPIEIYGQVKAGAGRKMEEKVGELLCLEA